MGPEVLFLANASSSTRIVSALLYAALIAGFVLLFVGIRRRRALPLVASALLLFLAAIPLSLGLFGLPIGVASAAILLGARRLGPSGAAARWLARGLGALAGAILLMTLASLVADGPGSVSGPALAYSALTLLVLGVLAVAGWWPMRRAASTG